MIHNVACITTNRRVLRVIGNRVATGQGRRTGCNSAKDAKASKGETRTINRAKTPLRFLQVQSEFAFHAPKALRVEVSAIVRATDIRLAVEPPGRASTRPVINPTPGCTGRGIRARDSTGRLAEAWNFFENAAAEGAACFAIRLIETQPAWLAWFDAIGVKCSQNIPHRAPQRDPLVRIFYKIFWRLVAGVCCPRRPGRYATVRRSQRRNYRSRKTGGTERRLPRSTTSATSSGRRAISISAKGRFLSYDGVLATARTGAAAVAGIGCGEQALAGDGLKTGPMVNRNRSDLTSLRGSSERPVRDDRAGSCYITDVASWKASLNDGRVPNHPTASPLDENRAVGVNAADAAGLRRTNRWWVRTRRSLSQPNAVLR